MNLLTCLILGVIASVAIFCLQGCGQSGNKTTTTTTTTTGTTTTSTTTTSTRTTTTSTTTTTTTTTTSWHPPLPLLPVPNKPCSEAMHAKMRARAQHWVNRTKLSIALGYAGPDGSGDTCSMGYVAHASTVSRPELAGKWILGSITKVWTATAILKLQEAGVWNLDEAAFPYMEQAYAEASGGFSLVEKFGPQIKNVTIRELLSMRGSIQDYYEDAYQMQYPQYDLGPTFTAKKYGAMTGQPLGSCGVYSSMSYVLLGLVLLGQSNMTWDKYDQNIWREFFPEVQFSQHGTCSKYVDIREAQCTQCRNENGSVNVMDMSCTNGYTCGNMVATPKDVARFMWHLFEGRLLQTSTMQEMLNYQFLGPKGARQAPSCGKGMWGNGFQYGLGVQNPAHGLSSGYPGHEGETYGFASVSAYDPERRAVYVAGVASFDQWIQHRIWNEWHDDKILPEHVMV